MNDCFLMCVLYFGVDLCEECEMFVVCQVMMIVVVVDWNVFDEFYGEEGFVLWVCFSVEDMCDG